MSQLLQLSSKGEVNVVLNMQQVLSRHDGPQDLGGLVGKYLYIAVLVKEETGINQPPPTALLEKAKFDVRNVWPGGISQEAEFASVKFVNSPFTLSLVSTSPFIKPGLPYNIQVC